MQKIVGIKVLSFEELYTVVVQIGACLNSRPITPMSNDISDLRALTPGHFIIGEAINSIPDADITAVPVNRLTRYQLLTQIRQHFWNRWSQEYISQLQQQFKWKSFNPLNLKIGTMVLIKNKNTPAMTWSLGRIFEIHPGTDGIIRVVTIRTSRGLVKQTLSKICILPIE